MAIVTATYPPSGNAPALSGDLAGIRSNWTAIENFFSTSSHYTFTSPLSGMHKPGICGLLKVYTGNPVLDNGNVPHGVMGIYTTVGELYSSAPSAVFGAGAYGYSKVRFTRLTPAINIGLDYDQAIPSGTTTTLKLESPWINKCFSVNSGTGEITVHGSGFYLCNLSLQYFSAMVYGKYHSVSMLVNGVISCVYDYRDPISYGGQFGLMGFDMSDVVPVEDGDVITFKAYHTSGIDISFRGEVNIVRLS